LPASPSLNFANRSAPTHCHSILADFVWMNEGTAIMNPRINLMKVNPGILRRMLDLEKQMSKGEPRP
jgi:hypothetical protein